jgi:hypothetical protein
MRHPVALLLALLLAACTPAATTLPPSATPLEATAVAATTPAPPATTPAPPTTPAPITPRPVCTPPLCLAGEVYYCPSGDCPGGCGTGCATPTPTLLPAAFCQVVVRTPPPEAPTVTVGGTPDPNRRVDPHVAVCLSAATLAVGQRVALVGRAVDIGHPAWTLHARENGAGDFEPIVQVSGTGDVSLVGTARQLLFFVEAQRFLGEIILHFEAQAPGRVEWRLSASGEVHYGYPGPATWSGGASDILTLDITP